MDEELENQALDVDADGENGGQGGDVAPEQEWTEARTGGGEEDGGTRGVEDAAPYGVNPGVPSPLGERRGHPGELVPPEEPARAAPAFFEENARLLRQYDEQIAGLGVPNPYTGKPFKSFQEFREYGKQFQREQLEAEAKQKGTTVTELGEERENQSFLTRKRQEEKAQREAAQAAQERQRFLAGDLQDFTREHPGVDVAKLEQNPKFKKFAGDRLYRVPLGKLYDDFVEIVGDAERAALEKASGRSGRSTGGAQGGGMELLTPSQRTALDEWNRENPEMKMTPKEFMGG